MKVYVLEVGEHELRCLGGVYSTWQLARMAQLRRDPLAEMDDIIEFVLDEDSSERQGGERG